MFFFFNDTATTEIYTLSLHDALPISSDYEGTSNAVLEAMALETPVVATAAGGTTDIVTPDHDGLIVPCGDVEALVRAIDYALRDPAGTRTRVDRARRRIEDTLSFDQRTAAVERIYLELAERRSTRPRARVSEQCV